MIEFLRRLYYWWKPTFGDYDRARLYEILEIEVSDKTNLAEAFNIAGQTFEQASSIGDKKRASACYEISTEIKSGGFGPMASRYLPENEVALLNSAQEFGFALILRQLGHLAELGEKFRRAIRTNIFQPLALLVFALFLVAGSAAVIPLFRVPEDEWSLVVQWVDLVGTVVIEQFFVIAASLVALILVLVWAVPNYVGTFRTILDRYPPFSLYRIQSGAQFLFFLVTLAKANHHFDAKWAKLYGAFASAYVKDRMARIVVHVGEDRHTSASAMAEARTGFPDDEFVTLMIRLERSGGDHVRDGKHLIELRLQRWLDKIEDKVKQGTETLTVWIYSVIGIQLLLTFWSFADLLQAGNSLFSNFF